MPICTRGPHVAIFSHHHAVPSTRSHTLHTAMDYFIENILVDPRPIPQLTAIVSARNPHAAINSQHDTVTHARSYGHRIDGDHLQDIP